MKRVKVQLLVVLVITLCMLNVIDAAKCKNKKCPGSQCCTDKNNCINIKTCGKSCQKSLGKCVTQPQPPSPNLPESKDGKYGQAVGLKCPQNLCCSQYNYCGNAPDHCENKCQTLFGRYEEETTTPPTTPTPDNNLPISKDGKCGKNAGTRCVEGECCSEFDICGVTTEHCQNGCQSLFGTCGTPDTVDDDGPEQFDTCTEPNTIALTFDDGPRNSTNQLLDDLKAKNVKATFFVNGHNDLEHCIYDYAPIIRRAFDEGHQIAFHTWSHPHLPEVSEAEIIYQLEQLEVAFKKIIGAVPIYFRPPYGEHNALVRKILKQRGYKMVLWDIDTLDWEGDCDQSKKNFDDEMKKSPQPNPHIVLNHDTVESTSTILGPYEAKDALERGYKVTTVGECVGQPNKDDWYKDIGDPQEPDATWRCTTEDMHGA